MSLNPGEMMMPGQVVPSAPALTRRQLLQAGGIGMVGLSLPHLLQASAPRPSGPPGSEKSCIFICLYGGQSQIDTWDMKPDAPAEIRGPYRQIQTATSGTHITELMPRFARLSNHYCLLRSLTHHQPEHTRANSMLLSGQTNPQPDAPSFGSVAARLRPATRNVPSYVWLQKFGGGAMPPDATYLSGGFLGARYAPLAIGTKDHTQDPSAPGFRVTAFDFHGGLSTARLDRRRSLLNSLEQGGSLETLPQGRSLDTYRERAYDLITGPQARTAFDLSQEPARVREWYGMHPLGQHLLMARRLIEAGVRLVGIVAWCGLAPGDRFLSVETWDMHGNGTPIFGTGWNSLGWAVPRLDESLSALLEDLIQRGLLDDTLVAAVGEFGRTPRIDPGGRGRDHWPHCYSAMLAGAGIRGGAVHGASDRIAAYVQDNPVSPEDFSATIYHALGIDPATRLAPDGFTRPASMGQPLLNLFS